MIQFNDTTNHKGIVQFYEKEIGDENGGSISGNTVALKKFTAQCNLALDDFTDIAIKSAGRHQHDDSGQTKHPIIYANIVSGQQDYEFITDQQGNAILDIYRVFILANATATDYQEIYPIDQQSEFTFLATEGTGNTGTPYGYDKTGNYIFLDPKPNYNATNGLKMMIAREAPYFVSTDTTKKPGVPGTLHAWFYLKPALEYARRNNLTNERKIKEAVLDLENKIKNHFAWRARDERKILTANRIQFR